jgi:hypothetical protein
MHAPADPSSTCILDSWHSSLQKVSVPRANGAVSDEAVSVPYEFWFLRTELPRKLSAVFAHSSEPNERW